MRTYSRLCPDVNFVKSPGQKGPDTWIGEGGSFVFNFWTTATKKSIALQWIFWNILYNWHPYLSSEHEKITPCQLDKISLIHRVPDKPTTRSRQAHDNRSRWISFNVHDRFQQTQHITKTIQNNAMVGACVHFVGLEDQQTINRSFSICSWKS
jgi:mRNA deadenylase 3'-5' endonuclease subunit Ccr4